MIDGIEEEENNVEMIETNISEFIKNKIFQGFDFGQVNAIRRIGKLQIGKTRPVLGEFLALRTKNYTIMKSRFKLNNYPQFITEDFPKEVLDIRKKIIPD